MPSGPKKRRASRRKALEAQEREKIAVASSTNASQEDCPPANGNDVAVGLADPDPNLSKGVNQSENKLAPNVIEIDAKKGAELLFVNEVTSKIASLSVSDTKAEPVDNTVRGEARKNDNVLFPIELKENEGGIELPWVDEVSSNITSPNASETKGQHSTEKTDAPPAVFAESADNPKGVLDSKSENVSTPNVLEIASNELEGYRNICSSPSLSALANLKEDETTAEEFEGEVISENQKFPCTLNIEAVLSKMDAKVVEFQEVQIQEDVAADVMDIVEESVADEKLSQAVLGEVGVQSNDQVVEKQFSEGNVVNVFSTAENVDASGETTLNEMDVVASPEKSEVPETCKQNDNPLAISRLQEMKEMVEDGLLKADDLTKLFQKVLNDIIAILEA